MDKILIIFSVVFLGLFVQHPGNVIDKKAYHTSVTSKNVCPNVDQFDLSQNLLINELEEDSPDHSKYFLKAITNKLQRRRFFDRKHIKEKPFYYLTCRLHTPWLYKIPPPIS